MEDKKQKPNQDVYSKVVLSLFMSFAILIPIIYITLTNLSFEVWFSEDKLIDSSPKNDLMGMINFIPIYFVIAIIFGTVPMLLYVALYMAILKRQKNNFTSVVTCAFLAVLIPVFSFCYLNEYKTIEILKILVMYYINAMPVFLFSHYLFIQKR